MLIVTKKAIIYKKDKELIPKNKVPIAELQHIIFQSDIGLDDLNKNIDN